MRGEHEYAATSEGSPRLFFYNSTFANNATYLAIYFGTALFIALNAVFALAFVDDLSRNEKIFEDQKHRGRGNEKRRRRRHRRHDELEEGGGGRHISWRYFEMRYHDRCTAFTRSDCQKDPRARATAIEACDCTNSSTGR